MVDSVPEFVNRTRSSRNRRHSSSASATAGSVVTANCVPDRAAPFDGGDDARVGVAGRGRSEAVVEVEVVPAVDVPHLGPEATGQVDGIGVGGLERRGHAEGQ